MEEMANNSNNEAMGYDGGVDFFGDSYTTNNNVQMGGSNEWPLNNVEAFSAISYVNAAVSYNNFSETHSDGNITPSASLMDAAATSRWHL